MADTGPMLVIGPRDPGWADLRDVIAVAVARCEATVADLREDCACQAVSLACVTLADLAGQLTRIAWEEDLAAQLGTRAYERGFADGAGSARRVPRPRRGGPRPLWPRGIS